MLDEVERMPESARAMTMATPRADDKGKAKGRKRSKSKIMWQYTKGRMARVAGLSTRAR